MPLKFICLKINAKPILCLVLRDANNFFKCQFLYSQECYLDHFVIIKRLWWIGSKKLVKYVIKECGAVYFHLVETDALSGPTLWQMSQLELIPLKYCPQPITSIIGIKKFPCRLLIYTLLNSFRIPNLSPHCAYSHILTLYMQNIIIERQARGKAVRWVTQHKIK